jgi:signal transduction histidine kinase
MQAHGGYIAARNHPGGGAVFRWALPLGGLVQAETSEPATAESQDA